MFSLRGILLGIGILVGSGTVGGGVEEPFEVGLIESFNAPVDHYALYRGPQQANTPIQPGGRLLKGDRIEVKTEEARLTIWLFDSMSGKKSVVVLSQRNNIYVVEGNPPNQRYSRLFSAVWDWAANELGMKAEEEQEKIAAAAAIRGGPELVVPLLEKPQVLAAGRRAITIAWPQSEGAVGITIKGPGLKTLAKDIAHGREWTSRPIDLKPGIYQIVMNGTSGQAIKRDVEVIAPSAFPALPEEPAARQLPPDLTRTIRATWLASQGRGRYALESFQSIVALARYYHPAKVLRDSLIEGSLPSRPPST